MGIVGDYSNGTCDISFTLRGCDGTIISQRRGEQVFYAASTIKLAVAMAVIQQIERGALDWEDTVPSTHRFTSARGETFSLADDPDEVDMELPPDGTAISVRGLLDAMITRSSNEATNMLIGIIGLPMIQRLCHDCHMQRLHVERQIGDLAARDFGTPNEVTTNDLSSLMFQAVSGTWAGEEYRSQLCGLLRRQRFPVIGDVLPSTAVWGSKSGDVVGIEHDVAFIADVGRAGALTLAICTRGYEPQAAHEAMHALAEALLDPWMDDLVDA